MITRRAFLTGLTATTALVAVPGAYAATVNHDKIMALLESKLDEHMKRTAEDLAHKFWADDTQTPRNFGLQALLSDKDLEEIHNAPEWEDTCTWTYTWKEVAANITIKP